MYLAEQTKVRRTVVLKILREDTARDQALLERFRREARVTARLDPRYVTMVHDLDQTDDGRLFVVMEYVEGRTLREMLDTEGALPVQRALALGVQVAEGLRGAHGAGVLHGNLTPRAIMVLADDSVKLSDFGLEAAPASERADLGALGAVLYEMLTGASPSAAAAGAGTARPPRLRDRRPFVPDSLDGLVMRMLEADPEGRPPALEEVIRGLGAAATEVARRIQSGEVDRAGVVPLDELSSATPLPCPPPAMVPGGTPRGEGAARRLEAPGALASGAGSARRAGRPDDWRCGRLPLGTSSEPIRAGAGGRAFRSRATDSPLPAPVPPGTATSDAPATHCRRQTAPRNRQIHRHPQVRQPPRRPPRPPRPRRRRRSPPPPRRSRPRPPHPRGRRLQHPPPSRREDRMHHR